MNQSLIGQDLTTPAFLVDEATVRRNCDAMREKARHSGVLFRPHVKTHKTVEIARLQAGAAGGPITVSTLAEAEFFAAHGFEDITYAVPFSPAKLNRAAALARKVRRLNLLLDSFEALRALEEFQAGAGVAFSVFLKVDCGYHRAGVDPDSPESLRLALALANSPGARFAGLLTHAGHSYQAGNRAEISQVAAGEAACMTRFQERIQEQGVPHVMRSTGATPTSSVMERFTGTDEVRPGNYVFFDAFQAKIGACDLSQCAVSVLATVIGGYPGHKHLLVDAGALALSKDPGPDHVDHDFGYGIVCDLELRPLPMKVKILSQEHGKIEAAPEVIARFPVGTRLRIIPNHSCLTAAMYDTYHVIGKGEVTGQWRPARGW